MNKKTFELLKNTNCCSFNSCEQSLQDIMRKIGTSHFRCSGSRDTCDTNDEKDFNSVSFYYLKEDFTLEDYNNKFIRYKINKSPYEGVYNRLWFDLPSRISSHIRRVLISEAPYFEDFSHFELEDGTEIDIKYISFHIRRNEEVYVVFVNKNTINKSTIDKFSFIDIAE